MALSNKNMVCALRLGVIGHVAQAFWNGRLAETVDRIPHDMRPRNGRKQTRCCIYKDRAILRERIIAALGFRLEDEQDDSIPLRQFAQRALEEQTPRLPVLTICDIACHSCMKARYFVSDACQGCVARSCAGSCRFGAIAIVQGRAHIDPDRCRNCGQCHAHCPYHAIVRLTVPCEAACPVQAIRKGVEGRAEIDFSRCTSCGRCLRACPSGAVMERSDVLPVLMALASPRHVTALVAPAMAGQFKGGLPRIITALKKLGFDEVVEVAAGADLASEQDARHWAERMQRGDTFMTTSCCPAYVEAVRRHAPELLPFVSESRTPMHYAAEISRAGHPDTVNVFLGPCVAQRTEALGDPLVDFVLTFEEAGALLDARGIRVDECEASPLGTASGAGRGYAVTGGVAAAIRALAGDACAVRPVCINGLSPQAMRRLRSYVDGDCPGNLVEVMACAGGCVGGSGVLVEPDTAARLVERFARATCGSAARHESLTAHE